MEKGKLTVILPQHENDCEKDEGRLISKNVLTIQFLIGHCASQYNPMGILLRIQQEAKKEFKDNFSETEVNEALLDILELNKNRPLTGQYLWQAIQNQFPLPNLNCAIDTIQVCQAVIAELKRSASGESLKIVD